mgnify:CR=1 FL=1|jgi:hypothetical protein
MNRQEPFIPALEQLMQSTIEAVRYTPALTTLAQQVDQLGVSFISIGGTYANQCSS